MTWFGWIKSQGPNARFFLGEDLGCEGVGSGKTPYFANFA